MAMKPLKLCRHPGCGALTREGYCPKHKPKQAGRRESSQWHDWYRLSIWTKHLRPDQLAREPYCRECARKFPPGDPRHRTRATDVDHIIPHRGCWELFTDPGNLQSLCHSCHSQKTMAEKAERMAKK